VETRAIDSSELPAAAAIGAGFVGRSHPRRKNLWGGATPLFSFDDRNKRNCASMISLKTAITSLKSSLFEADVKTICQVKSKMYQYSGEKNAYSSSVEMREKRLSGELRPGRPAARGSLHRRSREPWRDLWGGEETEGKGRAGTGTGRGDRQMNAKERERGS